jgi:hypothetical protein
MQTLTETMTSRKHALCRKHVVGRNSAEGFFCNRLAGHKDGCSKFPELPRQGLVIPVGLLQTRSEISTLRSQLRALEAKEAAQKKDVLVRCLGWSVTHGNDGCGATHRVSTLEYIQTHWYTYPSGCTGGDFWTAGEGQFVCPSCGALNRLYERPEIEALKPFFKSVRDTHDRH